MTRPLATLALDEANARSVDRILTEVAATVERLRDTRGWSEAGAYRVNLVLEEVCCNVATHGAARAGRAPSIRIAFFENAGAVSLEVRDDGPLFDPTREAPNIEVRLEPGDGDVPVGGLGIALVHGMTSGLGYARDGGWNRLTMCVDLSPTWRADAPPEAGV